MTLKDKDVAAAFNAPVPTIQFPTDFPPEIRDTINTIAARQQETADAITQLRTSLSESTKTLRDEIKSASATNQNLTTLAAKSLSAFDEISKMLAILTKQPTKKPWHKNPWTYSLIAAVATLLLYVTLLLSHIRDFDTATLAPIEQILASDDYADYLSDRSLRRHLSDQSLAELGLQPLPSPTVSATPLDTQRQSLTALHDWHTRLTHLYRNFILFLIIAIAAPPLLALWLSLFPTKK